MEALSKLLNWASLKKAEETQEEQRNFRLVWSNHLTSDVYYTKYVANSRGIASIPSQAFKTPSCYFFLQNIHH